MRIEQLRYLVEVAKAGSISLAAERIYISQPTISEAIQDLEEELGIKLFVRTYRGVSLTESGKIAFDKAQEILVRINDLQTGFESPSDTLAGNITISASRSISNAVLPHVLTIFYKKYPNVNVSILESDLTEIHDNLEKGKTMIGLFAMVNDGSLNLKAFPDSNVFFHDRLYAIVGNPSPLSTKKNVSLLDLIKYPMIFYSIPNTMEKLLNDLGKPKQIIKCYNFNISKNMVLEGLASAIVSKITSDTFLLKEIEAKKVIMIPIENEITITYGWVYSKKHPFTKEAQEFIRILEFLYHH